MNLIEQWQFGYMALLIPAVSIILYLVIRQLRWLGATIKGTPEEKPKEMKSAFIIIISCLGFFAGGLMQSTVDLGVACDNAGHKVVSCIANNWEKTNKN